MNTKTMIDVNRYVFNDLGMFLRQLCYNHEAATNLPTSNAEPIAIIGTYAPANSVAKPSIEYPAAISDMLIALINVINVKNMYYLCLKYLFLYHL